MYLTTRETLGLIPPLYRFFVLPPEIQAFLDKVRKSPKSFEPLLLTMELHPDPLLDPGPVSKLQEFILSRRPGSDSTVVGKMVLGALKTFLNQHRQDPRFKRHVEAENNLASQLQQTTAKLGLRKLEPFLLNAWLENDSSLPVVGKDFADKMFPTLRQAISQSKVPDTQFFKLGRFLRQLAEEKRQADGAFKVRTEMELRNRMLKVLRVYMGSNELKPFLVEAALSSEEAALSSEASLWKVGARFAQKFMLDRLLRLASESEYKVQHFTELGKALKAYASGLRRRDRAFDRLVTQEEMKRRQSKQKRMP